jgi:hypothetical protein
MTCLFATSDARFGVAADRADFLFLDSVTCVSNTPVRKLRTGWWPLWQSPPDLGKNKP